MQVPHICKSESTKYTVTNSIQIAQLRTNLNLKTLVHKLNGMIQFSTFDFSFYIKKNYFKYFLEEMNMLIKQYTLMPQIITATDLILTKS